MALIKKVKRFNCIRYICRADSAVDLELSDRKKYESNPVEYADSLVMKEGEEPTVFVLNFETSGREHSMIKDSQMKGLDPETKEPVISMGAWALRVAKITIKGIENPAGVEPYVVYKKDGRGYIADEILDKLSAIGVVDEVWQLYLTMRENSNEEIDNAKK